MAVNLDILGRFEPVPHRQMGTLCQADVAAGFPSPADDYVEGHLDLNEHLIEHPAATFFVRVSGDSMTGAGIHHGDLMIVDRAVEPSYGNVVVAIIDGQLTVKRITQLHGHPWLAPANEAYPPIEIGPETDFRVWGVCRYVIHAL
ncbi:MAG: translesion error-prone DNA polymerase V autoproteolytic subunit [Planctomycetes bacterium]|nr:translesion error-prone DNA polymerase V autoproteolytic subunit [Planctomycetota bacterium]